MPRKPPELPHTTDEDIDRVIAALSRRVFREVFELSQRVSIAADACMRFAPVAIYCRYARESRGEDLKSAAKTLKVPQRALRQIEECEALDVEFSVVSRYARHLGLQEWFGNWSESNRRMVAILGTPLDMRDSPRTWVSASAEAAIRTASAPVERGEKRTPARARAPRHAPPPSTRGSTPHEEAVAGAQALQLEVVLEDVEPPVWRRILVSSAATLHQLHHSVQQAMGWENTHLYQFEVGGNSYSDPTDWDGEAPDLKDSREVRLRDLGLKAGTRFEYQYDFGDDWRHRITVERVGAASNRRGLPVCLAGERACPPEDSGGPFGYEEKLEALRDPGHPEHREIREWMPHGFDPEAFDLVRANRRLAGSGRTRERVSPGTS